MTDRILPERAVVAPIDCDRFDALLAEYLENALPSAVRAAADAHRTTCDRCRALTDDLLAITREAAALGPIEPARDLWAGIAARIEAPVVPITRTGEQAIPAFRVERTTARHDPAVAAPRDRFLFSRGWLAAAASVLVATSVGATYAVMRLAGTAGSPTTVAAGAPSATPDSAAPDTAPNAVRSAAPSAVASAAPSSASTRVARSDAARERDVRRAAERAAEARLVATGADEAYAPAVRTYDREIATLRAALKQRADLDSSTVAVLQRSLRVIDQAIAESRQALRRDPGSRLLSDQLTRALDQKVELLRTAVLLPARS